MAKVSALLRNRNFILLLAVSAGLSFDNGAQWTRPLVLPALSFIITLAMTGLSGNVLNTPRPLLIPALLGIFMNYVLLGNLIIGMSAFLIHEEPLWMGFIVMAATPPAVAVIPFAAIYKGDKTYAVAGIIGAYVGALIIIPVIALGLLDTNSLDIATLAVIAMELIILPSIISWALVSKGLHGKIAPLKGILTDWGFFLILYTLVGLNREVIIGQPFSLAPAVIIAFASTFLMGFLIGLIGSLFHFNKEKLTSLLLLGTLKNYGLAGGLALSLLSKEAALPAMVSMIFMIIYEKWLDFKMRWA